MSHPELPAEQAYVDRAYRCLERMRDVVARAGDAADGEVAQAALDAWSSRRLATFEDAERGLLFGRLDFESVERPLYVGRRWVHGEEQEQVVVSWQAPAARPFYTATPADPQRVTLRRRFRTQGRRLLDIADESLDGTTLDGASVGDFLLEELERSRDVHMRDIVATIQGDQYRLITHDPDRPLVIQGGPGTGKTAVGLHRASWLLYTFREQLSRARVLVVGPNRTFMEYVSHVLPALGENAVEQRAVADLVDGVVPTLVDSPEVARLKADVRLAEVLARAAELKLEGAPEELLLRLEGEYVRVREREVRELLRETREQHGTTAAARERFRMALVRAFYADYGNVLGGAAIRDGEQIELALRRGGYLARMLDRAWPAVTPGKLVRSLFTTPKLLARAADGILEPEEQRLLRRRGPGWSDGDVALLDEAHALVGQPPHTFAHVVVDEAQDLTPMQLRMAGRRARDGALTVLGDVAQATGAVTYSSWGKVLPFLPGGRDADVEELRHAYRVPARDHGLLAAAPRRDRTRDRAAARVPNWRRAAARAPCRRAGPSARGVPGGVAARARGGAGGADRGRRAPRAGPAGGERLRGGPAPDGTPGEGARVRSRHRRGARPRGGSGAGAASTVRRADAPDEDARRRSCPPAPGAALLES